MNIKSSFKPYKKKDFFEIYLKSYSPSKEESLINRLSIGLLSTYNYIQNLDDDDDDDENDQDIKIALKK